MSRSVWLGATALAVALLSFVPRSAQAHETRAVGKYQFTVGFSVEPAFEGEKNGVSLRVVEPGTPAKPIEGIDKTLQVEVTHLSSGKAKTMPLRTVFGSPGSYTADLIPTSPGQYRFRFFGMVESLSVNEQFTSGERFDNVDPADEIQFPEKVAQVREVQGVADEALDAADDADSAAGTAQTLAIAAIVVALIAVAGTGALALRRR